MIAIGKPRPIFATRASPKPPVGQSQILELEDYKADVSDLNQSADCVEKVGFSRILAICDVSSVFKALFLLEINFIA
ncbi:hypothetical protein A1507_22740 [Methylomonas koyamae]|uniref:Uncharacterized protein n=1 Tax=Methylomonas koyamae TaxID=702114 RepID=A0A177NTT8_9GAMM|nr:hypothetical protein [Methylomonas koyamae]OAI20649.1 hypothetical protein A1507_22740 [Methylomonas koyamae]